MRCHRCIVLKLRGRFYDGGGESLEYSLMVTWTRHREGGRVQENMTKIRALGNVHRDKAAKSSKGTGRAHPDRQEENACT